MVEGHGTRGDAGGTGGPEGAGPETATGMEPNVEGALSYLLGIFTGILFLVLEKNQPFVRFHAFQSVAVSVVWIALSIATSIISMVPILGWILGALLGLILGIGGLILWVFLMWQAYEGREVELPLVGPWARSQVRS